MRYMIVTRELSRSYKKALLKKQTSEEVPVLKGIDLDVEDEDFLGIMGRSGCGKTTLLRVLGLLDKPTGGEIIFKGKDTRDLWKDELADIRRREIGFVFQDFYLMDSLSVRENIMLPMILDKAGGKEMKGKALDYAGQFEISHLLDKAPYELSGGEKQRVAICRALINNPDLVLADEPTGNLDSKSGKIVTEALERINSEMKKTIIMVTHDPKVASCCKRIVMLSDGQITDTFVRNGSTEEDKHAFYQEILKRMHENA